MNRDRHYRKHLSVLFGSSFGLVFSIAPIMFFTFSVFLKPIASEFGWDRATVSSILSVETVAMAFLMPFLGGLIDRIGVRHVLLPSIVGMGLVTLLLSILPGVLWVWYAVFVLIVPIVGAGSGVLSYTRVLSSWFDRRRGIALGVAVSGIGVGTAIFVPLSQYVIDAYSWREAYLLLGGMVLGIGLPVVALTVRNTPEEVGLAPDFGARKDRSMPVVPSSLSGLTVKQAVGSCRFWLLLVSIFLVGAAVLGSTIHLAAMYTDRGIDGQTAAAMMGVLGMASMVGRIVVGMLFDRFFAPRVAMLFFLGPLAANLILASGASGLWQGYLCAILLGLGIGAEIDLISYLCGRYFGLKHYGKIYGILLAVFNLGAGVGPIIVGYTYDTLGSYVVALYGLALAIAIACCLLMLLGPYPEFEPVQESRNSAADG